MARRPRSLLFALLLLLAGCGPRAPQGGLELILAPPAGAEPDAVAEALRQRLHLAGWPWYELSVQGGELALRVGPLEEEGRPVLDRLVLGRQRLEAWVEPEALDHLVPPPGREPLFSSDDVETAWIEKARAGSRVEIQLARPASARLEEATRAAPGGTLLLFSDRAWLSAALLQEPIRGGLLRVTLPGEDPEAAHLRSMELVVALRAPLPGALRVVREDRWGEKP